MRQAASIKKGSNWTFAAPNATVWFVKVSTATKLVEELSRSGGQTQERAVDVQITRLRRKIEVDPKQPRYLQTVRGAGYMLAPE